MCYITLNDISKFYTTGEETIPAVSHVSFHVDQGEFIAITGPSGCGKSTLLHIMGGLSRPSSGSISVRGKSLYDQSASHLALFRRREAGIVYQFYNLVPELTARENLILPALMDGRKVSEKQINQIFEILGIPDKKNSYPDQLSGGQQQKIAVGRALISHPPLLLADEPTGNLDSQSSRDVMDLLCRAARHYQQTVLMITHNMNLTTWADRVFQVADGRLGELGGGRK